MSGFKVSKGKGLRQANRQLESMGCITQLQHHPHLGFSLHIRLTFMEHKFGHSDTLECCFLGNISTFPHFRVQFLLLPISRPRRYVYVPSEENSSKSLEMERIMREARLWLFSLCFLRFQSFVRMRELCKGLYSSTYEDSINSKVKQYIQEVKNSFI